MSSATVLILAVTLVAGALATISTGVPNEFGTAYAPFANFPCRDCLPMEDFKIAPNNRTQIEFSWHCFSEFPRLNNDGTIVSNGGIPQRANLTLHLTHMEKYIDQYFPNVDFDGNAPLDFEEWTPIWADNTSPGSHWHGKEYQTQSINYVKERFPHLNEKEVVAKAEEEFQAAGIKFFVETVKLLRKLRPKARWGWYGFPQGAFHACCEDPSGANPKCGYGSSSCGAALKAKNDIIAEVWASVNVMYPSIYLPSSGIGNYDNVAADCVSDVVAESIRLVQTYNSEFAPILPYYWAMYHNGSTYLSESLSKKVIVAAYKAPYSTGMVIWGSSSSKGVPENLKTVTGPAFEWAVDVASDCSTERCGGKGWCTKPFGSPTASNCTFWQA